jgi:hypothetical protein
VSYVGGGVGGGPEFTEITQNHLPYDLLRKDTNTFTLTQVDFRDAKHLFSFVLRQDQNKTS